MIDPILPCSAPENQNRRHIHSFLENMLGEAGSAGLSGAGHQHEKAGKLLSLGASPLLSLYPYKAMLIKENA